MLIREMASPGVDDRESLVKRRAWNCTNRVAPGVARHSLEQLVTPAHEPTPPRIDTALKVD